MQQQRSRHLTDAVHFPILYDFLGLSSLFMHPTAVPLSMYQYNGIPSAVSEDVNKKWPSLGKHYHLHTPQMYQI